MPVTWLRAATAFIAAVVLETIHDVCLIMACSQKKQWLIQRMENRQPATKQQQLAILRGLVDADAFERFLASKFPASKVSFLPLVCLQFVCQSQPVYNDYMLMK